jgi:magnesium transporter
LNTIFGANRAEVTGIGPVASRDPARDTQGVIVDCAVYERGRRRPGELPLELACEASRGPDAFVWLGMHEPSRDEFEAVRSEFGLHELAVEDAIKAHQRPKLEVYGDTLFVVLKPARYDPAEDEICFGEILIFLGDGFIITVRHGEAELHDVRLRSEQRPELLRFGAGAALYAIVDRIVDDYQPVIGALDREVDAVEEEVFSPARTNSAETIYRLKREVLHLDAAVTPLAEPLEALARGRHVHVAGDLGTYFRDVHDHLLRDVARIQGLRDALTSALTANLTQVAVRQNEDVRKISSWAAILAVPTMVAGIYGMNFEYVPELGWRYGFPAIMALIAVACLALWLYFRRIGWL